MESNVYVPDRVDDCHISFDDIRVVLRVRDIGESARNGLKVLHQNFHVEKTVGVSRVEVSLEHGQLVGFILGGWEDVYGVLGWLTRGQDVVEEEIDRLN
jgi:hypothetical protein